MNENLELLKLVYKNAKMGISFKGRELTDEQEKAILNIISENSQLDIVCVVQKDSFEEKVFKEAVEKKEKESDGEYTVTDNMEKKTTEELFGDFYFLIREKEMDDARKSVIYDVVKGLS